jgi:amino acid adenylation domain-containing protein
MNTILSVLEKTSYKYGNKSAFKDLDSDITFSQLADRGKRIGSRLIKENYLLKPVILYMNRTAKVPVAMMGVICSGNFYVMLDVESPDERINKIIKTLNPAALICDKELHSKSLSLIASEKIFDYEDLISFEADEESLLSIQNQITINDPVFAIFTSGSTGNPKGTIISHENVMTYMDWFVNCFDITTETVFGSQTPFYFSMSVSDMFATIFTGATFNIIPKSYFTFPAKLIDYLNERKINTIYWVPTALGMIAKFDLFNYAKPKYLEKVLFAGEVMPIKYLNYWKKYFPSLLYANLFGPTETTDICTYYIVNREFNDNENLPIGIACKGARLLILDEKKQPVTLIGELGELFVSAPFVALGYYKNEEITAKAFIQNPLHNDYRDIFYNTGDLVKLNKYGELDYAGRKDNQIKHMGYRIEIGEIEAALNSIVGVELAVCLYNAENDNITAVYEGDKNKKQQIMLEAQKKLPSYMLPEKIEWIQTFPVNANGKIDKKLLKEKTNG